MNRSQQYIAEMLDRVPVHEFSSPEDRETFAKIRRKLADASNLNEELKTLYKLHHLSQVSLRLLWIARQVEQNPSQLKPSPEEEKIVLETFQNAFSKETERAETTPTEDTAQSVQHPSKQFEMKESLASETTVPREAEVAASPSIHSVTMGTGWEQQFASLLEKLVEAVQSGSEERDALLEHLVATCNEVLSPESGMANDFREFSQLLKEFLQYISANQYLDDVRVMNITSNITDPVLQWANAAPEERAGLLESSTNLLRDSQSMFE